MLGAVIMLHVGPMEVLTEFQAPDSITFLPFEVLAVLSYYLIK